MTWHGLTVHRTARGGRDDDEGIVEFTARSQSGVPGWIPTGLTTPLRRLLLLQEPLHGEGEAPESGIEVLHVDPKDVPVERATVLQLLEGIESAHEG